MCQFELKFTYYPHPLLRKKTETLVFDNEPPAEILHLIESMKKICRLHDGVGLAAPQVGLLLPIVVIGKPLGKGQYELVGAVNPVIIEASLENKTAEEGCLSLPKLYLPVERPARVVLEAWFDDTLRREKREYTGMAARIVCHEVDHVQGKLFIDHVDDEIRAKAKPDLNRIASEHSEQEIVPCSILA